MHILSVPLCFSVHMVVQGKLQPFLTVATQTLESFLSSLDDEVKTQTEDHNSQEHQFVLGLAGTITSELNALVDTRAIYISQHIRNIINEGMQSPVMITAVLITTKSFQTGAVV